MPAILLKHVFRTVETPLTVTSLQWPFLGRQVIHLLLLKPLNNGHLSTTITFFCPHGGHYGQVQYIYRYFWQGIYLPFSKCKLTCTLFDC